MKGRKRKGKLHTARPVPSRGERGKGRGGDVCQLGGRKSSVVQHAMLQSLSLHKDTRKKKCNVDTQNISIIFSTGQF